MKFLPILLVFFSVGAYAAEDCIFDESAYITFINKYNSDASNSRIGPDGRTLLINRDGEQISVSGGGCDHLGVTIELISTQPFAEEQFLNKTLELSIELGAWLINTKALEDSIEGGRYQKIDGTYHIEVDAMTVFNCSYDDQGRIFVEFYIN